MVDKEKTQKFEEAARQAAAAIEAKKMVADYEEERKVELSNVYEKLQKASYIITEEGRQVNIWDKVHADAKKSSDPNAIMSYSDFRSSLTNLMAMYSVLADALNADLQLTKHELGTMVTETYRAAIGRERDLKKYTQTALKGTIPKLIAEVKIEANGTLKFKKLETGKKDELTSSRDQLQHAHDDASVIRANLNTLFHESITEWLHDNGYIKNNRGVFTHKDSGDLLTQDVFLQLQKNGSPSLAQHFTVDVALENNVSFKPT